MLLTIRHRTDYLYDIPVPYALQRLRLTPVNDDAQTVSEWSVETEGGKVETQFRDGFGNQCHLISAANGVDCLSINVTGKVETRDTSGIRATRPGPIPLWLYLQETALTKTNEAIREMASSTAPKGDLDGLHALMETIAERVEYLPGTTHSATTASDALANKSGVCQDHAHIFCAAARSLGVPSRYISGYLHMEGVAEQVASHAWAESYVEGLGWVGFDCSNKVCPDERYVRIATGRDYGEAGPVSGIRFGHGEEKLAVRIHIEQ